MAQPWPLPFPRHGRPKLGRTSTGARRNFTVAVLALNPSSANTLVSYRNRTTYDCFYASVFEHENPALRSVPLAVQQKQIVVTCNYEARRRGLHKLQLISEAKKICPDVVIVLGEDLTRFRNASKQLYTFLRSFSWNARVERLGFDEVFLDITDIIDYNISILNPNDLPNAFFCLDRQDPTKGFPYDATRLTGHLYPKTASCELGTSSPDLLHLRLVLASHFANHLRSKLEEEKGYTATVGISTNKLLAKLVGNTYKPNAQTTLVPPYLPSDATDEEGVSDGKDNVTAFLDDHEVGKIPGIGFKIAQKLRAHVLQRAPDFSTGLVYGGTKETVLVRDVRTHPGIGPETLGRILGGPGVPHGTGTRIWGLLNGCDDADVSPAREVPRQISIEDSYMRLDTLEQVTRELRMLAWRLVERMRVDLVEEEEEEGDGIDDDDGGSGREQATSKRQEESKKRWLAHPKTLRLSTRPRPPRNADASRNRSFARISKSANMPGFVFDLNPATTLDTIADKLLDAALLPLFRKLHPEKRGWNLSLVNVAATNMVDAASEKGGAGRDIGKMFRKQNKVLRQWRVEGEGEGEGERDQTEQRASVRQESERFEQPVPTMESANQTQGKGEKMMGQHVSFSQRDLAMVDESDKSSTEEDWILEPPGKRTRDEPEDDGHDEWLMEQELGRVEPRALIMQALHGTQQEEELIHANQQILLTTFPHPFTHSSPQVSSQIQQDDAFRSLTAPAALHAALYRHGSEDVPTASQDMSSTIPDAEVWVEEEDEEMMEGDGYTYGYGDTFRCEECGAVMPVFALGAHWQWHEAVERGGG
ncbi:DNA polymerase iota [Alternaria panax]|uniref:DNA polymerase iota n=1 Tax=Alternaria panax TaxID=48097 RepID=A0AAD4F9K1_9PLEO|nr:DNA polymerase iota [Alternaria panax]